MSEWITDSKHVEGVENEEDDVVDEASQECAQHHERPETVPESRSTAHHKYIYTVEPL